MVYTSGIINDLTREETLEELQDNKLTVVCEKVSDLHLVVYGHLLDMSNSRIAQFATRRSSVGHWLRVGNLGCLCPQELRMQSNRGYSCEESDCIWQ